MRRKLLASVAFVAALCGALPANAGGMRVALDEVQTITFPAQVATVYVGNPAIADINMIDARHAFILGKGYGSTNIVALNQDGRQVSNTNISVLARSDAQSTVTLNRGVARVTYSCTSNHCEMTPQPGDGKDAFDAGAGQIASHEDAAKKAAQP